MSYYLSIILFTPLVGALLILLINKQNENAIRWVANIAAFAGYGTGRPACRSKANQNHPYYQRLVYRRG